MNEKLNYSERLSILETNMIRLVGEDGNGGIIGRIEEHLTKLEKFAMIYLIAIIANVGLSAAHGVQLMDILKLFVKP